MHTFVHTTTPEQESSELVNSMRQCHEQDDIADVHDFRKLSLSEIRSAMHRESAEQECYVKILCLLLDECLDYNDSQHQVRA